MKIVSPQEMIQLEEAAYTLGCNEEEFMDQAGIKIAEALMKKKGKRICFLCGKGNNGGDGLTAAFHLMKKGYQVSVVQPSFSYSPLNLKNRNRFIEEGGIILSHPPSFEGEEIIVDALFGTGFNGEVKEPYFSMIDATNESKLPIISIDIPSGLNGETGEVKTIAIRASETYFLGLPKTGFFLGEGSNYTGKLQKIDFGLPSSIINNFPEKKIWSTPSLVYPLLPKIKKNRHKYESGYVVGLAGCRSMPGAALLSSLSALRAGSGIVRLLHCSEIEHLLINSPYELIKMPVVMDDDSTILTSMNQAKGVFIGPGLGRSETVAKLLSKIIPQINTGTVIDADALFAWSKTHFSFPPQTILTPHLGEMKLLLGSSVSLKLNQETISQCKSFSEEYKLTLVLKGCSTFIFHPQKPIVVSTTGNPGMATAGTGDVLTGILASLLSQKMEPFQAAIFGTYFNGIAGELAVKQRKSPRGLLASDIIARFGEAFHFME